ncbi:hypothetical protein AURDEDRAFT_117835, partial [Auricularia subglabra TFB-10046 SS5]
REAETSIKFFALRVFAVPSIAAHCVLHHQIVPRILETIAAFFTNQILKKRIVYPPNPNTEVDVDSMPFKNQRFVPIFSDLRSICSSEAVQRAIVRNAAFITQFGRVCQMFMGTNANKRAVANHVEYEPDAWISVFNVTLSLSRVVKVYGEAAILAVTHQILLACTMTEARLEKDKYGHVRYHTIPLGGNSYTIVNVSVLSGWVSFHHAPYWLLAEHFKHVDLLTHEKLSDIGATSLRDVIRRQASETAFLTVIDLSLRVVAMIAQIRTGLWVRNGFAFRGQLLHYREPMLCELRYDQDLFILQSAFVILDSDVVLVSMLNRFELRDWFTGVMTHAAYEGPHLLSMLEEFLYVVIACVAETGAADKLTMAADIRREILHALAAGPCSFRDLCKRVAERMADDVGFEKVLLEVATFQSPDGPNESGMYELKDEAYDEVNPFFYHYTRNKREEVESILKARLRKTTGDADPVIVPKPIRVTMGPFITLPGVLMTEVLVQIVFYSIHNVLVQTDRADAILDQALYLIMFGLGQHPEELPKYVASRKFELGVTVWHVLAALARTAMFKSHKKRLDWCFDHCGDAFPTELVSVRAAAAQAEARDTNDADAAKKRSAQARKDAGMKQFAAQRQSILEQLEDEDEDGQATEKPESFGTCISFPHGPFGHSPDRHAPKPNTFPPLEPYTGSEPPLAFNGFPYSQTKFGLHASECGHMMHLECFTVYTLSIRQRHRSQAQRNHPENIQRKEFICPLCKSLGNTLFPVTVPEPRMITDQNFSEWIRSTGISLLRAPAERLRDQSQYKTGSGETRRILHDASEGDPLHKMVDTAMFTARSVSGQSRHLRDRIEPVVGERGAGLYLPEDLCAYTIACTEVAQRGSITDMSESNEYGRLPEMLSIPPISQLAGQEALQNVLAGWCSHYGFAYSPSPLDFTISLQRAGVYDLITLPPELDTLFVQEKTVICPRCKTVPNDLAVCLICGTIAIGECNIHTRDCGGVVGLYFLVRRCALLYLYTGNGSFGHAPYLNVHGEIDFSMR